MSWLSDTRRNMCGWMRRMCDTRCVDVYTGLCPP